MVYAGDIITDCWNKTKELFFPIRKEYWVKMGIANIFSWNSAGGSGGGNSFGNSGSSNTENPFAGMTFQQIVSQINTQALDFLSKYGYIIGIVIFLLYLLGLFFTYISSVFTFIFLEGILKKEIKIRKSFSENKTQGRSLFFFRFYFGLISLAATLVILSPILYSFFTNRLIEFNLWWLIPIILALIIFYTIVGIFLFLVTDFVVPIMYLKKYTFGQAWDYFKKIAKGKKFEIFMYWLIKIVLGIVSAIAFLLLLIPFFLIMLLFVVLGVAIFFGIKSIGGELIAIITIIILGLIFLIIWAIAYAIVSVPIPSFLVIYSIEMVKKLDGVKEETKKEDEIEVPEPSQAAESKKTGTKKEITKSPRTRSSAVSKK